MTKTPLIAFRCRPEALRAALDADAAGLAAEPITKSPTIAAAASRAEM